MFADQVIAFSENLDNLRDFVDMVSSFLDEKTKKEIEENAVNLAPILLAFHKFNPEKFSMEDDLAKKIEDKCGSNIDIEIIEDNISKKQAMKISVKDEKNAEFSDAIKVLQSDQHRKTALYNNSLISLISSVEWFLAQLIHKFYRENPGIVGSKEKQFSLDELAKFDSVEDARNFLIEKNVEGVLRGSIEDWLVFLKTKLKLSMGYLDGAKSQLIEAGQRRNVLVHNGGIVNRIYLSSYPCDLGDAPTIGDTIRISPEYLNTTISLFERCFLLIASELWKKVGASNEERGQLLIDLSFQHLVSKRFDVAESLSLFAANDKSLLEIDQLYAKINYWIAKKLSGDFESIAQKVRDEDFSAKSRLFVLAQNCLLDNYGEAKEDIQYMLEHEDDFTFDELNTWPLFEGVRQQEFYQDFVDKYRPEKQKEVEEEKPKVEEPIVQ